MKKKATKKSIKKTKKNRKVDNERKVYGVLYTPSSQFSGPPTQRSRRSAKGRWSLAEIFLVIIDGELLPKIKKIYRYST